MPESQFIFLTGFMASGKTTLGKRLAKLLAYDFVDLDTYIEQNEGRSISSIFEQEGELQFRALESKYLHEILNLNTPTLLSLGGGTICFNENLEPIKSKGLLVYLQLSANHIADRLTNSKLQRPILKNFAGQFLVNEIERMLQDRKKFYDQSHITINSLHLTPQELHKTICAFNQKNNL